MSIFLDHVPRRNNIPVVTWKPGETRRLILHGDTSAWAKVYLHWLHDHKRSIPCKGRDCTFCDLPKRICVYAQAIEWSNKLQKWLQRISPINESGLDLMTDPHVGDVLWMATRGKARNSPVKWSQAVATTSLPLCGPFDVMPTLLWMWGVQHDSQASQAVDKHPDAS